MTVLVLLLVLVIFAHLTVKECLGAARVGARVLTRPRRKRLAPSVNVAAVLEAAGRVPSAARTPPPVTRSLPLIPPLESADPLWDRELDGGVG
jgi:hypothetical protein